MDIRQITRILPHRYPFLLVDRIIELVPGERVVGIKNVTINEEFFLGHFPGHPVMPGVLIVESMAQVAGILAFASTGSMEDMEQDAGDKVVYFMSIDRVKFRQPVIPGDQLRSEVVLTRLRGSIASFEGKAYVGDRLVAEAEMKAMLVDRADAADKAAERE
ncbi:MAG: 3-hydroxyacyl-ACP dehydratase FabZ [bacterium]|nr:MAG: 3-hydroxyacyl-ACP dehydratase FabZ [bacterium]